MSSAVADVPMIEKWLVVRGLTIAGSSYSLELWCFSMATDNPITVIPEKTVWSTSKDGIDLASCVVLMTLYTGFLCTEDNVAENILPAPNTEPSHEK